MGYLILYLLIGIVWMRVGYLEEAIDGAMEYFATLVLWPVIIVTMICVALKRYGPKLSFVFWPVDKVYYWIKHRPYKQKES